LFEGRNKVLTFFVRKLLLFISLLTPHHHHYHQSPLSSRIKTKTHKLVRRIDSKIITISFQISLLGNQHQQLQYQNINPNIHTGSIPATGRSNYSASTFPIPVPSIVDKSVEDTRMIIEQSNRLMVKNNCATIVGDDKIVIPANSYIDQPMLSAMQKMFHNTNGLHAAGATANSHVYQPQQIYFN
jgi:hypothetical protein